jgi:hypothetical protein
MPFTNPLSGSARPWPVGQISMATAGFIHALQDLTHLFGSVSFPGRMFTGTGSQPGRRRGTSSAEMRGNYVSEVRKVR